MILGLAFLGLVLALAGVAVFLNITKTKTMMEQFTLVTVALPPSPQGLTLMRFYVKVLGRGPVEPVVSALTHACNALRAVWPDDQLHALLDGTFVIVMPSERWYQITSGRNVAGECIPGQQTINIGSDYAALAHELAHMMEAGPGRLPVNENHEGWSKNGIEAAIQSYLDRREVAS